MGWLVYLLFFVSGACGLIYQVVWTRIMTHIFGSTVFAVSIVLTAFMAGLAIGSYFLGHKGDRSNNPLRLYAWLETGIALTALISLWLMDRLGPFHLWMHSLFHDAGTVFSLARFSAAFLVLIIPTIFMGATLPILSRFIVTRMEKVGKNLGALYAINTFGAVCGSLLTGFVLISALGVHATVYLAAALNAAVGMTAWLASKNRATAPFSAGPPHEARQASPITRPSESHVLLLFAFAASGFTSFAYEIYWTRALVFLFGNSTYAFVMMLTAFLTGIALGGYCARFFIDRIANPLAFFAWIELFIGLSAAVAMPVLITAVYSDFTYSLFRSASSDWGMMLLVRFGVALFIMLIPTLLIGITFPLVGKICIKNLNRTSADVGRIYAVNTVGNILGACIPGLLILPLLGINRSILLMAAVNIAIGGAILLFGSGRRSRLGLVVNALLLVVIAAVAWLPMDFQFPSDMQRMKDKVLFYKEGIVGTTKVFLNPYTQEKNISVDGVNIGGTHPEIDAKQQILAHLPKLLSGRCETELSIGLGSGVLIGESARHACMKKIVCVEIAPSVVEGAAFFREENYHVLDDPRVEIVVNDGVNFLMTSQEKYDIISSDAKSKPEHGGNGIFFTREYYTLMQEHLNPGGIAIQWFPYHYPNRYFRMIIKTFIETFPHAVLWFFPPDHTILVGSGQSLRVDFQRMKRLFSDPSEPLDGLRKYGITSAEILLSHCLANGEELKEELTGVEENSFEHPDIEFYSLKEYAIPSQRRTIENLKMLRKVRDADRDWSWIEKRTPADTTALQAAYDAEGLFLEGLERVNTGSPEFRDLFNRALTKAPGHGAVKYQIFSYHLGVARRLFDEDKFVEAEPFIVDALGQFRQNSEAHYIYGSILAKMESRKKAVAELEEAVSLNPGLVPARLELASLYIKRETQEQAVQQLNQVLLLDPENETALDMLRSLKNDL
ncbi:MAG: fused MFS/spermidine synthase [Planctomycetota bacterium]